jgi:ABC-2 type transport system ATP-binding protein
MRELVREERDRGATIFFSSHILEQVEAVCDRIGILRGGELVAEDSVSGLREAAGTAQTLEVTVSRADEELVASVGTVEGVSNVTASGDRLSVACDPDAKTRVLERIESEGVTVEDFSTEEASLEELFVSYTTDEQAASEQRGRTSDGKNSEGEDGERTESESESEEVRA